MRLRLRRNVLVGLLIVGGLMACTAAPAWAAGEIATETGTETSGATPSPGDDLPITVRVPGAGGAAGEGTVSDAQLRWGLSREANSGAFAGGCNFLSAGAAGDSGGARVWGADDGLYASTSGEVRIEKATASGAWRTADFASKCLDPAGVPVSAASLSASSNSQVVIDGGVGSVDESGLSIRWTGSFTVAFYGGMTYWTATDPVLTVEPGGTGRLVATLSGYGTSMDDLTTWEPLPAREVVLADLRGVDLGSAGGFSVQPQYLGVQSGATGQAERSTANEAYWGSFPPSFIDFQQLTGQAGYWYTSGGQRDAAKPATTMIVNYDATAPIVVPEVPPATAGGAEPVNTATVRPASGSAAAAAVPAPAPAVAAPGTALAAATPLIGARDPAGLVPDALSDAEGPLLPIVGTLLAVLVSILCVLQLSGRLVLPWSR